MVVMHASSRDDGSMGHSPTPRMDAGESESRHVQVDVVPVDVSLHLCNKLCLVVAGRRDQV